MSIEEFQATVTPIPILGEFFAQHMGGVVEDLHSGLWTEKTDTIEEITGTPPMKQQAIIRDHHSDFAPSTASATAGS